MPVYVVVDAAVAGAWLFAEPFSTNAQPVLEAVAAHRVTALAPDRFAEEVLRICQKKTSPTPIWASIQQADAWERFLDVVTSPIFLLPSDELHERAWQLAQVARLTTHDALYVALAQEWDAEFWTLDETLAQRAKTYWNRTYDLQIHAFPH